MSEQLVTAATVRTAFLWPVMDARALNIEQQQLLFDPSPGVDSLTEYLGELAGQRPGFSLPALPALARITSRLLEANAHEGGFEIRVAGAADQLAVDLRDRELNGGTPAPLAAKAIARRLRGPLVTIAEPAGAEVAALVDACHLVAETIRRVPRLQLLTQAVNHELGAAKFALLAELVEEVGAAQLDTADAGPTGRENDGQGEG